MTNLNRDFFSFRNRYIPALLIIALFSILGFVNVKEINSSIENEGKIINISGRQRMLSQRLVLLASNYLHNPNISTRNELLKNIVNMEKSHFFLLKSNSSAVVADIYEKGLDKKVRNFIEQFKLIATDDGDMEILKKLRKESQYLLEELDFVVHTYEIEYEKKLKTLQQKGKYLLLGILLVLLLEWLFIFRPASLKMKENTKNLEETIARQLEELQKSIDIISENVIYSRTDTKGFITYASKAFCKISGYTNDELLGKPHNIIRHIDMPKEAFKEMWQTIQSGKSWQGEVKNLKKDKGFYWVKAYISPEYDTQGKLIGYAAVRQDITHKKEIEELNKNLEKRIVLEVEKNREKDLQIFQNAKMASLRDMIGNIAHQWRQPLSAISTMASGMLFSKELGALSDETFSNYCNKIVENTQFLSHTIDTFRDFVTEKKELTNIILQERLQTILHIQSATLNNYKIALIDNINYSESIELNLFVEELDQVLMNIITNAKDVLSKNQIKNPWIKIGLENYDDKVIITVEDNAGGINDDILPHIFEPYFTTKHQSQGTGLGLYISYKIVVESLGGKLYAKNSEFGAKFFVELKKES
jgi:PAS domain S-box-containing protein